MSRTTTRVAQAFFSSSRRFNNQGVKSAGVLPPVSPHKCREEVRNLPCLTCRVNGELSRLAWEAPRRNKYRRH